MIQLTKYNLFLIFNWLGLLNFLQLLNANKKLNKLNASQDTSEKDFISKLSNALSNFFGAIILFAIFFVIVRAIFFTN